MPAVSAIRIGGLHGVHVEGLSELNKAFREMDKNLYKELRATLKQAVEPVRLDAQVRASREISNIGDYWYRMRVGVTTHSVYAAPSQRSNTRDGRFRRPNLANLLMDRAMAPALNANADKVEGQVGQMLDHLFNEWEKL